MSRVPSRVVQPPRRDLLRIAVPVALVAVAIAATVVELGDPARIIFDETYYVNDARAYLEQLAESDFAVHPPVGKWLIALGIAVFGDGAFGWRIVGAALASGSVLLVYLIGLRLFRRVWPAGLAALLLATDGLWIAQARTAMLDIHLAFFVVAGVWLLLRDHDRTRPRAPTAGRGHGRPAVPVPARDAPGLDTPPPPRPPPRSTMPRRRHPGRWLAGVAFGLATATKWSGALPLLAAVVLVVGWELADRKRLTGRYLADPWPAVRSVTGTLVLLPVAVYLLTWIPWLVGFADTYEGGKVCEDQAAVCEVGVGERLAGLGRYHVAIARFHLTLEAEHNYRAPAYTWPVIGRPVVYYYETPSSCEARAESEASEASVPTDGVAIVTQDEAGACPVAEGEAAEILAAGNPALWWGFIPASILLAAGIGRRDRRAGMIAAMWGVQFAPWLLATRPVFIFYAVPVVPFLALGVAYAAVALEERRELLWPLTGAFLGGAAGMVAGLGLESAADLPAPATRWIGLGLGWMAAAATAGARTGSRGTGPPPGGRAAWGRVVGAVVAVAAVALLLYFFPVWSGMPLPEDAVRSRWWFDAWI